MVKSELSLLFLFSKHRELCRLIDFYWGSSEGILLPLCGDVGLVGFGNVFQGASYQWPDRLQPSLSDHGRCPYHNWASGTHWRYQGRPSIPCFFYWFDDLIAVKSLSPIPYSYWCWDYTVMKLVISYCCEIPVLRLIGCHAFLVQHISARNIGVHRWYTWGMATMWCILGWDWQLFCQYILFVPVLMGLNLIQQQWREQEMQV